MYFMRQSGKQWMLVCFIIYRNVTESSMSIHHLLRNSSISFKIGMADTGIRWPYLGAETFFCYRQIFAIIWPDIHVKLQILFIHLDKQSSETGLRIIFALLFIHFIRCSKSCHTNLRIFPIVYTCMLCMDMNNSAAKLANSYNQSQV